jgi:hypothetical protein
VREAARNLVSGLQNLVDIAITFVIGTLPMLLIVVGIPGLVLYAVYKLWRRRRPAHPPVPAS